MGNELKREAAFVESQFENYVVDLTEFIRIPSVTQDLDSSRRAAEWIVAKLKSMNLEQVRIFETIGNPVIYAEQLSMRTDAPTVLIYGHYDVQLAEPLDDWESAPYEAERRDEYLFGRGGSDMKGQLLACLLAIEAMLQGSGSPVHLKFLIEGNEEAPPDVLEAFLPEHKALLSADISLNCDAGMLGSELPTISYGLRGGAVCKIRVFGPALDLHDGMFGGVIENPIHVLSSLIEGLHDSEGHIQLPGFYEKVRQLTREERDLLAELPIDESFIIESTGVPALWGDAAYSPVERIGARPSVNVRMFNAGELKGAIPRMAEARLVLRLVPEQDPVESYEQLKRYVSQNTPNTVTSEVEYVVGYSPYLGDRAHTAIVSLENALETTWSQPVRFRLVGGGIPVVEQLKQNLGIESLLTGFSLPDDHIHGPNERLHLPTVRKGIEALILFFHEYGASIR